MYDTGDKISFGALKTELKAAIWPNGAPENCIGTIDKYFGYAFVDLQRWVSCLQAWHTDVFPQCATYFRCGLTALDAPRGRIRRVRTFEGDFCDPVTLTPTTIGEVYCWSRKFIERIDAPANVGLPQLPAGFRFADASTDSQFGRALAGLWTNDRGRIYVAPWIQSRESVVVEWDGIKRKFADTDLFPDEEDFKRAMQLFVQKEFARDLERDFNAAKVLDGEYAIAKADLIYECEKEKAMPKQESCPAEREYLWDHRLEDDSPASADTETVVALLGDYGSDDSNELAVSRLVKGWQPQGIVTLGDNAYQGSNTNYDLAVGKYYRMFMFPYRGTQPLGPSEADATVNKFWPCLGNHDIDHQADYLAYFVPPDNERYYDVVIGHIHFFILNGGKNTAGVDTEPTGNTSMSMQAAWLRARVAQSTARWKVAIVHFPPYSSYRYPGSEWMRWDFKEMGINLVVAGHNHMYERVLVDELNYIVAGNGGAPLYTFGRDVVDGSVIRDDTHFGAVKLVASCAKLTPQFFGTDGTVLDAVDIT